MGGISPHWSGSEKLSLWIYHRTWLYIVDSSSDSTTLSESLAPLRASLTCQKQRKNNPWSIAESCVENGLNSTWVPVRQPGSEKWEAFSALHSYCHWKPLLHSGIVRSFVPLLQHPPHLKGHQKYHLCWCNHPGNAENKMKAPKGPTWIASNRRFRASAAATPRYRVISYLQMSRNREVGTAQYYSPVGLKKFVLNKF